MARQRRWQYAPSQLAQGVAGIQASEHGGRSRCVPRSRSHGVDQGRQMTDINGIPDGAVIEIRNDDDSPAVSDPKLPEEVRIPDGLYRLTGADPQVPGYRRIETLPDSYLLGKAHEHLIKEVYVETWRRPNPDWFQGVIGSPPDDPDDDGPPDDDDDGEPIP